MKIVSLKHGVAALGLIAVATASVSAQEARGTLRFGNALFESVWNREHVQSVHITVAEEIGVEKRGAYYEQTGALRDMLQNDMAQLLTLTAMEPPAAF